MAEINWRDFKTDSQLTEMLPLSGPYIPAPAPLPISKPLTEISEQLPLSGPYFQQESIQSTPYRRDMQTERTPQAPILLSRNIKARGIGVYQDPNTSKEALSYFGLSRSKRAGTRKSLDTVKGIKYIL